MKNKRIKVISLGNLSMGGAGKTPHAIALANEFIQRGEKTAILSLGYKGGLGRETNVISDGRQIFHKPPLAADEPYMMALNCPGAVVITGKRRELSLEKARDVFNASLAILDDGFQYRTLKRDADVLLLDHKNPLSTGLPFPFGYLREFPRAVRRADVIIFTRAQNDVIPEKTKKYIENKPTFFSDMKFKKIILKGEGAPIENFKGTKIAAFSAIASNSSFLASLSSLGFKAVYFKGFRDHKRTDEKDLEAIIKKGEEKGARLFLTTEKDFVKIPEHFKNFFGYVKAEIDIRNKELFFREIDNLLNN